MLAVWKVDKASRTRAGGESSIIRKINNMASRIMGDGGSKECGSVVCRDHSRAWGR